MQQDKNLLFSHLNKIDSLLDLGVDLGELMLDSNLQDEVLRNVPGIKTLLALIDIKTTISNYFWIKKFIGFIQAFDNFSETEKQEILQKADENQEILLEALDKIETNRKPYMLGKLFIAYSQGKLNKEEFLRINFIIVNTFSGDLQVLIDFGKAYPDLQKLTKEKFLNQTALPYIVGFTDLGSVTYDGYFLPEGRRLLDLGLKFIKCF